MQEHQRLSQVAEQGGTLLASRCRSLLTQEPHEHLLQGVDVFLNQQERLFLNYAGRPSTESTLHGLRSTDHLVAPE